MRGAFELRRRAGVLAPCLAAVVACLLIALPVRAFSIDPDPNSLTLGDILDREKAQARRPARPLAPEADRRVPEVAVPTPPKARAPAEIARPPAPPAISRPTAPSPPGNARPVPRHREPDPFRLPPDWPVLEDERPRAAPASRPPKPVVATPHIPRQASVVLAPRLVARPRLPVRPAQPPMPEDVALEPEMQVVEVMPLPPLIAPMPRPPRPSEVREVSLRTGPSVDERLLRDPTITTQSIAPPPASPEVAVEQPLPPARPQPPSVKQAEARVLPEPRQQRASPVPPAPPPRPQFVAQAETSPPRPVPVALPPLEEPPRVAPRQRAVEPAPPPKAVAAPAPQPVAASISAPDGDRFVFVIDQDLRQFLTDFSRRVGLRADIQSAVRGRLTRVKLPVEPQALLRDLEKRFDIEWMIEGEILKVASRSDLATRILPLGPVPHDDLIREMRALDIDLTRYPMKRLSESNSVILTAPAGYIGRVAALVETLRAGRSVGPELRIVRSGVTKKVEWD